MGIGVGVLLLLAGLVLVLDVTTYDVPRLDDGRLGALLVLVGAGTLVLALVVHARAARRTQVAERRVRR